MSECKPKATRALAIPRLASFCGKWSIEGVLWNFQSVAIVGCGAIGLYYGGRLAAAGENVKFLARSDFEALSRGGLKVESVHGDLFLNSVQVYQEASEIGPVDLVIVAWKATANSQLGFILPPLLHAKTQVLTLQNGLGNCEEIAEIIGPERVLGGQCFVCINRTAPGEIQHTAGGRVTLGEWRPGVAGRAAEVSRRFRDAGISSTDVADLEAAQWEKLVWNIPFNGLSIAEGGVTTDRLLSSKATEEEIRALMTEVISAGRALGHELGGDLIDFNIERTRPMGAYRTSSMIDYTEGREVEIGPLWREPLRRGQAAGVAMPHTADLLEQIEARLAEKGGSC